MGLGFRAQKGLGFRVQMGLGFRARKGLGFRVQMGLGFSAQIGLGFRLQMGLGFSAQMGLGFRLQKGLGMGSGCQGPFWERQEMLSLKVSEGPTPASNQNVLGVPFWGLGFRVSASKQVRRTRK